MHAMMAATDSYPLNFGFTGKGNDSGPAGLEDQVMFGACGLKLHEDWGSTPASIDSCLQVGDKYDVQINIHTDTLNESGFVEDTINAFKGRTIHTYHTEGAGYIVLLFDMLARAHRCSALVAVTHLTSLLLLVTKMCCRPRRIRLGHTAPTLWTSILTCVLYRKWGMIPIDLFTDAYGLSSPPTLNPLASSCPRNANETDKRLQRRTLRSPSRVFEPRQSPPKTSCKTWVPFR